VAQPALQQKFHPVETLPGEADPQRMTRKRWPKAAAIIGTTIFHPVGTAKMGLTSDRARRGRRAACACSASRPARDRRLGDVPTITSGNTNSPTMMIAEKGAQMVLADQKALTATIARVTSVDRAGTMPTRPTGAPAVAVVKLPKMTRGDPCGE